MSLFFVLLPIVDVWLTSGLTTLKRSYSLSVHVWSWHGGLSFYANFISTMPLGYGSAAMPFYAGSTRRDGGRLGTSLGPGGYLASSTPVYYR